MDRGERSWREGKDLGGRGAPLERGAPLPPNLPLFPRTSPTTPPLQKRRFGSLCLVAGSWGKFLSLGRYGCGTKCGYRTRLVGENLFLSSGKCYLLTGAERHAGRSLQNPPLRRTRMEHPSYGTKAMRICRGIFHFPIDKGTKKLYNILIQIKAAVRQ